MLKENTVITLHPEDMFRIHAILLDEDRDAALDFLATVKTGTGQDPGIYHQPARYKKE